MKMGHRTTFLIDQTQKFKTRPLWIFLSVLFIILIPFLIIWLLFGEFNLLNQNNVIANNQVLWHGKITNENIQLLLIYEPFVKINGTKTFLESLQEWLDKDTEIIANVTYLNLIVLIPIAALLLVSFLYPFILRLFKLFSFDILPFSITFATGFTILFFLGLCPHFVEKDKIYIYWLIRIIVVVFSMFILFFFTNFIVNKILSKSKKAVDIALDYYKHQNPINQRNK